jgi:hypothetical protein
MGGLSRGTRLAALLAIVAFVAHAALFLGALLDDSYIAFRYARHLAAGQGLVFNPGERVEGFTSLSWVLISALCSRAGLPPERMVPLLGLVAGTGLVVVVLRAAPRLTVSEGVTDERAGRTGVLAALLVALTPGVAFYAVSGLEHTFFALLLTCAALALVERRLVAWALWTCAAFFTRPEAALLGPLGLVLLSRDAWRAGSLATLPWRRAAARAALVLVLGLAPYLALKQLFFGSILPNTLRAKEPEAYWAAHYTLMGVLPSLPFAGFLLCALLRRTLGQKRGELALIWLAFVLSCLCVGPDWMPVFRFFVPQLACLALAVSPELTRELRGAALNPRRAILPLIALAVFLTPNLLKSAGLVRSTRLWEARDEATRVLARSLVERGVHDIATINIGLLGYEAEHVTFTDLGGLVDREIGSAPGGHLQKHPSDAHLLARNPDVYLLTSEQPPRIANGRGEYVPDSEVERYVFSRPWFMERYGYGGTVKINDVQYYSLFFRKP